MLSLIWEALNKMDIQIMATARNACSLTRSFILKYHKLLYSRDQLVLRKTLADEWKRLLHTGHAWTHKPVQLLRKFFVNHEKNQNNHLLVWYMHLITPLKELRRSLKRTKYSLNHPSKKSSYIYWIIKYPQNKSRKMTWPNHKGRSV